MKKIFVFILTFAYLASTSGATIYIQQCMGKTISWSISDKKTNKCDKCGMHDNASGGCCTGHVKVLKVHTDQTLPEVYFNKISLSTALLPANFHFPKQLHFRSEIYGNALYYRPPPKTEFCILYCTFII